MNGGTHPRMGYSNSRIPATAAATPAPPHSSSYSSRPFSSSSPSADSFHEKPTTESSAFGFRDDRYTNFVSIF